MSVNELNERGCEYQREKKESEKGVRGEGGGREIE